jgi:hypothetical protein
MDFPESVKLEAKRRAHYHCVICKQSIFLEVHHILPQEEGGAAELDNAAPLCPTCHDLYGSNPGKRKFVREARDFWWEYCATRSAPPNNAAMLERLDKLQTELVSMREGQERYGEVLAEIKGLVADQFQSAAAAVSSASTVSGVLQASSSLAGELRVVRPSRIHVIGPTRREK